MPAETNVAEMERWASALSGAALTVMGIRQGAKERPIGGAVLAAAGSALIYRGATGHCPVYAAAGVNTANGDTRVALGGSRGTNVEEAVTINRSPEELYVFWRDFERLPRFMQNLVSVRQIDACRSHCKAKAQAGRTAEWAAEIINEIPSDLIAWRAVGRPDVVRAGA